LAPTLEGEKYDHDFDHLEKAGNFQDLTNPLRCTEGDTRDECLKPFPIVDSRFKEFERWEVPAEPLYSHQPLEEALAWRSRMEEKANNDKVDVSPFKPPKLSLSAQSVEVVEHPIDATPRNPVLDSAISFKLDSRSPSCTLEDRRNFEGSKAVPQALVHLESSQPTVPFLHAPSLPIYSVPEKHVAVVFFASWCPHSSAMVEAFSKMAVNNVPQEANLSLGLVDVDVEKDLAASFGIKRFPTVMFFPAKQTLHPQAVNTYQGSANVQNLGSWISKMLESAPSKVDVVPLHGESKV
jgi:thiol-disulfide isomerase/thioredoxin